MKARACLPTQSLFSERCSGGLCNNVLDYVPPVLWPEGWGFTVHVGVVRFCHNTYALPHDVVCPNWLDTAILILHLRDLHDYSNRWDR